MNFSEIIKHFFKRDYIRINMIKQLPIEIYLFEKSENKCNCKKNKILENKY